MGQPHQKCVPCIRRERPGGWRALSLFVTSGEATSPVKNGCLHMRRHGCSRGPESGPGWLPNESQKPQWSLVLPHAQGTGPHQTRMWRPLIDPSSQRTCWRGSLGAGRTVALRVNAASDFWSFCGPCFPRYAGLRVVAVPRLTHRASQGTHLAMAMWVHSREGRILGSVFSLLLPCMRL